MSFQLFADGLSAEPTACALSTCSWDCNMSSLLILEKTQPAVLPGMQLTG